MQLLFLALLVFGLIFAGCARRINDPQEVVDQSYVHRYGVPMDSEDWTSKGETGQVVTTHKNGVIVTESYLNGVLNGDTTYTFPHSGLIEKVETYSNGNLEKEVINHKNGTHSLQTTFPESNSREVYAWYDNSVPQFHELYQNNLLTSGEYFDLHHNTDSQVVNGKGIRTKKDPFGHLEGVDVVENGVISTSKTFYPNNAIKEITPYENGVVHGSLKTYLPGGEPASIEEWTQGEKTGITTVFENGEKVAEIPYQRGLKNGIEKRYRDGNVLAEEISWMEDKRHGPSLTIIGEIYKTDYFFQGKPVSKTVYDKLASNRVISTNTPK